MEALLFFLAAEKPSTDLEFLEKDLKNAFSGMPWSRFADTVSVVSEGPNDPWAWVVEECLLSAAKESGKEVVRGRGGGTLISYRVGLLGIAYTKNKGPFPWSGRRLIRESRFRIYLTATSGDSVVIWTEALSGGRTEALDWKWNEAIRVKGLSPETGEDSGTSPAEPLLTALILGGLLYVFYSFENR